MTREEKTQVVEELVEKFKSNSYFYVTDASGMTVAQINEFRRLCYNKGLKYHVIKNTMVRKALEKVDGDYAPFNENVLKGFTGIIFSPESGNLPAKALKEFRKKSGNDRPLLKGASIDSDLFIGDSMLDALSTLKSKNELIGDIILLLQSPAKNVVSALQSGQHKLAGIIKTLSEKE